MIILVAKYKAPSAKETVDALCDAILRSDIRTQQDLISFEEIPDKVRHILNEIKSKHLEQASSYNSVVIKKWDTENTTYEQIQVECGEGNALVFDCRSALNQWIITSIKLKEFQAK